MSVCDDQKCLIVFSVVFIHSKIFKSLPDSRLVNELILGRQMGSRELQENFEKLNASIVEYVRANNESQLVQELKEVFEQWIDSKRQLRNITTVEQLLAILKQRGLYKPEELYVFRGFKKIFNDQNFSDLVEKHHNLLKKNATGAESQSNFYGIWYHLARLLLLMSLPIFSFKATSRGSNQQRTCLARRKRVSLSTAQQQKKRYIPDNCQRTILIRVQHAVEELKVRWQWTEGRGRKTSRLSLKDVDLIE